MRGVKQTEIAGKVLITGGTGSWGRELCTQLLDIDNVEEIIIYSRVCRLCCNT